MEWNGIRSKAKEVKEIQRKINIANMMTNSKE